MRQSSSYVTPDGGNSVTETLKNSANVDPLAELNSYRSSIEYDHQRIRMSMGFKEQVAAVKVQSALRTFLVQKRLSKHANLLERRFNAE